MKKVNRGDEFKPDAATWNSFVDAAESLKRSHNDAFVNPHAARHRPTTTLKIIPSLDVDRFAVLEPSLPFAWPPQNYLDAFQNEVVMSVDRPSSSMLDVPTIIALEPIRAGVVGVGAIAGVVPALIYDSIGGGQYCDVIPSDHTKVRTGHTGQHRILSRYPTYPTAGDAWGYVLLNCPGPTMLVGKTTSTSGTIDLYESYGAGTSYGQLTGVHLPFGAVASGKWVMVGRYGARRNQYAIISAQC